MTNFTQTFLMSCVLSLGLSFVVGCPSEHVDPDAVPLCDRDGDGANYTCGGDDCNDDDPDINPDADEMYMIDHNCDGLVHEGAKDFVVLYYDEDQDGYGAESGSVEACAPYWPGSITKTIVTIPTLIPIQVCYGTKTPMAMAMAILIAVKSCEPVSGYVTNSADPDDIPLMLQIVGRTWLLVVITLVA